MKHYTARFTGRTLGAIGCSWYIVDFVKGEDWNDALFNLYKKYEHIQGLSLQEQGANSEDGN